MTRFDPSLVTTIRAEADRSNADYSVCEGQAVTGGPVATVRRGELVLDNGAVTANAPPAT